MQLYTRVADATKAIKEAVADPEALTPEAAVDLWRRLDTNRLENHGALLYELFLAKPIRIPSQLAQFILAYLRDSGIGFEKVLDHIDPELLLRSWGDYRIPPASLTPIILKNPQHISFVRKYPYLYTPELRDLLLKWCEEDSRQGYRSSIPELCKMIPAFFESAREPLLNLMIGKYGKEDLSNLFSECSSLLTPEEKVKILTEALSKLSTPEHAPALQGLYGLTNKYLDPEARAEVQKRIRDKITSMLDQQNKRDPMEAFLNGEMSWKEMAFAKLLPEEYQKFQAMQDNPECISFSRLGMMSPFPPWFLRNRY
jgi:hypothetical protein